MKRVSKRTSKRTSKRASVAIAEFREWRRFLGEFRRSEGFDLSTPGGFSRYLLAVYGKSAPTGMLSLIHRHFDRHAVPYDLYFESWLDAMAPDGMFAARGVHSLAFLPGDDIMGTIVQERNARGSDESNYSMNIVVASWMFSTRLVDHAFPRITKTWARGAAALESAAANPSLLNRSIRVPPNSSAEERSELPPSRIRRAFYLSQTPTVIVTRLDKRDLNGFGGDSESGDTVEAEVKARFCEPRCVEHLFVASAVHKLGRPVSTAVRRRYALDHHLEVTGQVMGDPQVLLLHPDANVRGRLVRHLPEMWTWYEIDR